MTLRRIALAACLAVSAACDEKLSDLAGPTPNLEPTLSSIQREIFNTTDSSGRRACITCHTGTPGVAAGLSLLEGQSYNSLVNRNSRLKPSAVLVIPGDPSNSYLIHKLEGGPDIFGARMPFTGGPYLTEGQIDIIRAWISKGAHND